MAKRLMLTLLALLTGLFAQIGPAQAQPCAAGVSEIGIFAPSERPACGIATLGRRAVLPSPSAPVEVSLPARGPFAPLHPTVHIGIDRARQ